MKRTLKTLAAVLVAVMLLLTLASCGGSAPASAEGDCGTTLKWVYDGDTKTLTIKGTGDMTDYENSSSVPWASVKYTAKTISVDSGVASLGDFAFYGFSALENVSLPETLTDIGSKTFAFCTALTKVDLPSSLLTLGNSAFEGCSALTFAFIPANVTNIGTRVFAYCYSVTDAAVLTDAGVSDEAFLNCRSIENLLLSKGITDENGIIADKKNDTAFTGASKGYDDAKFTESPTGAATVTVNYIYADTNESAAESEVRGDISYGDSFAIVSPAIDGYYPDMESVSGSVFGENQTFTVKYNQIVEKNTDVPAEEEEDDGEGAGITSIIAVVVFAVILVGIVIAAIFIVRYEKKTAKQGSTVRKNTDNKNAKKKK